MPNILKILLRINKDNTINVFTYCARQPFLISLPVFPVSGMGSAYPRERTLASPIGDCGDPTGGRQLCVRCLLDQCSQTQRP